MYKKKVVFFGLGGAGQRHLRILYSLKKKLRLSFFTFRKVNKAQVIKKNFSLDKKNISKKIKIYFFLKKKNRHNQKKKIAIISNPTAMHYKTAFKCAKTKMHIFVEKPFFCNINKFNSFAKIIKKKKLKFLVGYQRRFSSAVVKFFNTVKKLETCEIKKVNIAVNSYVPDWHKYEDYKKLYACQKILGGGSLLTECHELDLIIMMFGLPSKLHCKKYYDVMSIDVESRHNITFFYNTFSIYFKINMFSKKIKRNISLTTNSLCYNLDLNKNRIYKNNKTIYFKKQNLEIEYKEQIKYFFSKKMNVSQNILDTKKNLLIFNACLRSNKNNKIVKIYE